MVWSFIMHESRNHLKLTCEWFFNKIVSQICIMTNELKRKAWLGLIKREKTTGFEKKVFPLKCSAERTGLSGEKD